MNFDRIPTFLVNLDSRTDRLQHAKRLETLGLRLTRVSAVKGSDIDFRKLPLDPLVLTTLKTGKRFSKMHINTASELGCFLSHRNIWQMVANETAPCIVFEDDAEATSHANEWLQKAYEAVQNGTFDLVILGIHQGSFKPELVALPNWLETGTPATGTWAYVLSPDAAKRLWEASHVIGLQSDVFLPTVLDRIGFVQCFQQAFFWKGPDCKHVPVEDTNSTLLWGSAAAGALSMLALVYVYMRLIRFLRPSCS